MMDEATRVRPGEELDISRLEPYVRSSLGTGAGSTFAVSQFPGGFSNLTYALNLDGRALVLRRPPFGAHVKGGHDMSREFRILSGLARGYGKAPKPVLMCEDVTVIGAPFYVMERVAGVVLRAGTKQPLDPTMMRNASEVLVDTLADLHTLDPGALGLGDLGNPVGYVARQVSGWAGRYDRAQTDEIPELHACGRWLADHIPAAIAPPALIHNDFKYDNVMFDAADRIRIVAVLDWEMATIGDPLMDLGTTLGYWSQAEDDGVLRAFNLTSLPGNLDRSQVVARYAARTGAEAGNIVFYYVFGLFKIAVIVQQIYARYRCGATTDPRFARLGALVVAMARQATRAIDSGRLQ